MRQFPCRGCGASLEFSPEARSVACPYCGHAEEIPDTPEKIKEHRFSPTLAKKKAARGYGEKKRSVLCPRCAARTVVDQEVTATRCAFCGSPVAIDDALDPSLEEVIAPEAVLPFQIERRQAEDLFRHWVKRLWFAPTALTGAAALEKIAGLYRPYWTYDAHTANAYEGERGDAYYVTQTYTVMVNKTLQTRTRQVRHVRWSWVTGTFNRFFDDLLIDAGRGLSFEPTYDLAALRAFDPRYLSGFEAERYSLSLDDGWARARGLIDAALAADARRRVGGDEQRNVSLHTAYTAVSYKHVLLPVWVATYLFGGKVYRFHVNGQSGEVRGERPWSPWKIAALVLALLALAAIIAVAIAVAAR
ncbi:MAG: hypothetical protein HY719_07170 [Planctomycetes bacterium]|nr:hypothetical protein [Planctomycetota bacterium]